MVPVKLLKLSNELNWKLKAARRLSISLIGISNKKLFQVLPEGVPFRILGIEFTVESGSLDLGLLRTP